MHLSYKQKCSTSWLEFEIIQSIKDKDNNIVKTTSNDFE